MRNALNTLAKLVAVSMYVCVLSAPMGSVVSIVKAAVSQETVDMFLALADAAARGEICGAAVSYDFPGPGRHYALIVTGTSRDDPAHTRGTLCKFDHVLEKLEQG